MCTVYVPLNSCHLCKHMHLCTDFKLSLQIGFSTSFQLMKNFKVEYPEKEPFSVVQNVFLNADQKVPLKFTNV